MINFETFAIGLVITSTLTGLVTEAVKKIFDEYEKPYRANTLAGVVDICLSLMIGTSYIILTNTGFTAQVAVYLVAQIFMSWLCSMVGYDKVIQAISQYKSVNIQKQ